MHEKFRGAIKCQEPKTIDWEADSDDEVLESALFNRSQQRGFFSSSMKNQDTKTNDGFYCDPDFTPNNAIGKEINGVKWQRPHEICEWWGYDPPKMYVDGGCQLDICQGKGLGDCWFLAALATVSMHKELLLRVCPDQSFDKDNGYTGKFKFNFYQYGKWVEVTIDDRLPTYCGDLVYTSSNAKNEFWSALIEKAYAKLYGNYENLNGGHSSEALVDLTGGSVEYIEKIDKMDEEELYQLVKTAISEQGSLLTAAIQSSHIEAKRADGLVVGHAYSVTKIACFRMSDDEQGTCVHRLIRLRNPWGRCEWNGPFCDSDPRWGDAGADGDYDKTNDLNGEFWMPFKDFASIFTKTEICRLSVDDFEAEGKWYTDESLKIHSRWGNDIKTAGGCPTNDSFLDNGFMPIKILGGKDSDEILVTLQQKHRRKHKQHGVPYLKIGFTVYKVDDIKNNLCDMIEKTTEPVVPSVCAGRRDLSKKLKLPGDGDYIIVPSTKYPDQIGKYYLQCYVERPNYEHIDFE